ncbi:hypothetical protein GCM10009097_20850 [Pigmentiphaga daeguensis]|uniref:Uncharacterized protein n=1 Tax=Pigmentiphaga daeguensis TaxID=414049 RepID=A0ABN1BR74_9BURK
MQEFGRALDRPGLHDGPEHFYLAQIHVDSPINLWLILTAINSIYSALAAMGHCGSIGCFGETT